MSANVIPFPRDNLRNDRFSHLSELARFPDTVPVPPLDPVGHQRQLTAELHRKVLAHAIGRHVDTINRILAGEGSASLEVIGDIGRFFRSQGDPMFLTEVFGPDDFPPPSAPVAAALAALDQARQALLEGAAA